MNLRDEFFDIAEDGVRRRFASGNLDVETPKFFVWEKHGEKITPAIVDGDPDDTIARRMIEAMLQRPDILGVGYLREAWLVEVDAAMRDLRTHTPPSEPPERTLAILAIFYSPAAKPSLMSIPIIGQGEARRLGEAKRNWERKLFLNANGSVH